MFNPVSREKLVQKLEKHPRPENLNYLKIKKCNPEIWSEMLQSKTRSKDLKTQKMQVCILKVVGAISNTIKNINTMVHDCTDSSVLLSHVDTDLEQNRRDHIAYCLDNQYHAL